MCTYVYLPFSVCVCACQSVCLRARVCVSAGRSVCPETDLVETDASDLFRNYILIMFNILFSYGVHS